MSNSIDDISTKIIGAVPIPVLEDMCAKVLYSLKSMDTITPTTTTNEVMYAAGATYAVNRLLALINNKVKEKQ